MAAIRRSPNDSVSERAPNAPRYHTNSASRASLHSVLGVFPQLPACIRFADSEFSSKSQECQA